MHGDKKAAAGDKCPICGGAMAVDPRHTPERAIERYKRRDHTAPNVSRFVEHVETKAAEHGVIHKCSQCGYVSRQAVAAQAGSQDAQASGSGSSEGARA